MSEKETSPAGHSKEIVPRGEIAHLRLRAFEALGHLRYGEVRADGKWTQWSAEELTAGAEKYVRWALSDGRSCSFCDKAAADVSKLIAGPFAMICNECVALCNEIIAPTPLEPSAPTDATASDITTASKASDNT